MTGRSWAPSGSIEQLQGQVTMRNLTAIALGSLVLTSCTSEPEQALNAPDASLTSAAQELAAVEQARLNAFVEGNWELLDELHAEDFELINPNGEPFTKSEYLDPMKEGEFRYLIFEPQGEIRAEGGTEAGAVRYQSRLSVRIGETVIPEAIYRHTDYYEKRDGRWQVVFSQATPELPQAE